MNHISKVEAFSRPEFVPLVSKNHCHLLLASGCDVRQTHNLYCRDNAKVKLMKLISAAVHGYKRFGQKSTINLDGKLIAVIGPNEAGKSSFLKALQHLNHHNAFIKSGASQELTRGMQISDEQGIVEATFLLEEADKNAVAHIEDTSKIRWVNIYKTVTGGFFSTLSPRPVRDLSRRQRMVKALQDIRKELEESGIKIDSEEQDDLFLRVDKLIASINVSDEMLPKVVVKEIRSVAAMFLSSGLAAVVEPLQKLAEELNSLATDEEDTPNNSALQILFKRRPQFLFFDDEARSLQSEYNLDEAGENPPAALANLARLANLDIKSLKIALDEGDQGQVETIIDAANGGLRKVFFTSWSQADVTVRLRISERVLYILVGGSGTSYVDIAERSDGLRQYVSLLTFVSLKKTEQTPILLVDEVESHLHYDAQADLVQMLARQELATKVIYTTHSVGCLPEDLGTGVRLIEANSRTTSAIRNWFWETNEPGFSPLLFGIGAKTLAFLPVRFALVTEGPTDFILLPTLFREATGKSYIGFQVVPGLSVADEADIGILENGAPRTAYLVDSDKGGRDLHRQLLHAGIPKERIFRLRDNKNLGLVLEDFIDADVYLNAVNEELRRSHGETFSFPVSELPVTARPKAVEQWCKSNSINAPNKRAVAYRIIEQRGERQILSSSHQTQMKQIYEDIERALAMSKA